ncbi:MAG: ATP-binding protein [Thermoanaerobaculaceae bacterium]
MRDFLPVITRVIPEHVTITFAATQDVWTVNADPGQLEQVLMNLCINARDAMPRGGTLHLSTENVAVGTDFLETHPWGPPGEYARLTVRDTGTGMARDTLSHLFQPFFTTKEPGKGTGLGLATVYGIVKQHGGMVDVESEMGRGTTFHVYLPRVARPAQALDRRDKHPVVGGSERILVVDDEAEVRHILEELLTGLGYRVELAADGRQALDALRRASPRLDLVITDVVMPRMGGMELAEAARQASPGTKFLFSSGYSEQAFDAGVTARPGFGYLAKPYSIDELARKLRDLLDEAGHS